MYLTFNLKYKSFLSSENTNFLQVFKLATVLSPIAKLPVGIIFSSQQTAFENVPLSVLHILTNIRCLPHDPSLIESLIVSLVRIGRSEKKYWCILL